MNSYIYINLKIVFKTKSSPDPKHTQEKKGFSPLDLIYIYIYIYLFIKPNICIYIYSLNINIHCSKQILPAVSRSYICLLQSTVQNQ